MLAKCLSLSSLLLVICHTYAFIVDPSRLSSSWTRLGIGKGFGTAPSSNTPKKSSTSKSKGFGNPSTPPKKKEKVSPDFFLNKDPTVAALSAPAHLPSMNLEYPGLRATFGDPPVFEVDGMFDETMCKSYIQRAFDKGIEVQSATFNAKLSGSTRTSTTWFLPYAEVPELIEVCEKLTGLPVSHFEEPQIVRYEMGQQFSWHGDAIPISMQQEGGNRLATFIVYLNSLPAVAGGATAFRDLKYQCKPDMGKALLFFPCYADGSPDDRTFHCGQVAMETKYIAQIWVHERPYKSDLR